MLLKTDPIKNFTLDDGDSLYVPKRPNSINVSGEVLNPSTHTYNPDLDTLSYIEASGGFNLNADEVQALERAGLNQPKTVLVPSEYDNLIDYVIAEAELEYPLVLKTLEGSYGVGVALMESPLGLKGVIQAMNTKLDWDGALLQKYLPHEFDIRAHVLDGKVIASMKRTPPEGDFRTNIARGGTGETIELTDLEIEHCLRAAEAVNARWCGVDFIPSAGALSETSNFVREIIGRIYYKIRYKKLIF